jgi:hypothetical protein
MGSQAPEADNREAAGLGSDRLPNVYRMASILSRWRWACVACPFKHVSECPREHIDEVLAAGALCPNCGVALREPQEEEKAA